MEDRRVPVVLMASDPYNHHAKPLMSKSTALTRTHYVCYTCAHMRHTCRADLSEDLLNMSLGNYFPLASTMEAASSRLDIQSRENN